VGLKLGRRLGRQEGAYRFRRTLVGLKLSSEIDISVEETFQTNPRGVEACGVGSPKQTRGVSDEPSWG